MGWKKVRILYVIITLISFFLIILSYYLFREYIIIFVIIFGLILECFPQVLIGTPKKSPFQVVVEEVTDESTYKTHKKLIWIIYLIINFGWLSDNTRLVLFAIYN